MLGKRSIAYIGIDPGVTGAVAVIHDEGQLVKDWPGDEVAAAELVRGICLEFHVRRAAIEDQGAGPHKGKFGFVKLSENKGIWRGILASHGIPFQLVRPQEWMKGVVPRKKGGDDKPSLAVARRLFPCMELHRKKDHNRADALLIAEWARRNS